MSIQVLFDMPTSFSLDKHLVVGLLYHMLAVFRIFEASAYNFFIMATPVSFPPTAHKDPFVSIFSPAFDIWGVGV